MTMNEALQLIEDMERRLTHIEKLLRIAGPDSDTVPNTTKSGLNEGAELVASWGVERGEKR